jgi:D-ribose pyranase
MPQMPLSTLLGCRVPCLTAYFKSNRDCRNKDLLVIGDAGLPVAKDLQVIDLALVEGIPGFLQVVDAVLRELKAQEAIIATELTKVSPQMAEDFKRMWPAEIPLHHVPHEEFKERTKNAKAVVRTGEFTPYSNVILVAGVLF